MVVEFCPGLAGHLLDWYEQNHRRLPWRETSDPYAIWIAEIMLQQTRVETVIPYYQRWMELFPTVLSLAESSQEQVLMVWEGLGYYSRARNLHKTAKVIVAKHGGALPSNQSDLQALPGIGKAGAADILSIAFKQDIASVDGNIRRVIARLFEIDSIPGTAVFENLVQAIVSQHLPAGRAGDYNQAWMDLGAAICLPVEPNCSSCPLTGECKSYLNHSQSKFPLKKVKSALPVQNSIAAVLIRETATDLEVCIYQRPQSGLLAGLWSFPHFACQAGDPPQILLENTLISTLDQPVQNWQFLAEIQHSYTHFKSIVQAYILPIQTGSNLHSLPQNTQWVSITDLQQYPMGKIDRMIARKIQSI